MGGVRESSAMRAATYEEISVLYPNQDVALLQMRANRALSMKARPHAPYRLPGTLRMHLVWFHHHLSPAIGQELRVMRHKMRTLAPQVALQQDSRENSETLFALATH
jgi:hypothetical protein